MDHTSYLVANQIIRALETSGLLVFPNTDTCWHFDDKLAQKYLLEAIQAPLVPTKVFYSLKEAQEWIKHAEFPKVCKLRKGAGSTNVWLVKTQREAKKLCKVTFNKGFRPIPPYLLDIKTRIHKAREHGKFWTKVKNAPSVIRLCYKARRMFPPERGYVYFQDFIPGLEWDYRVKVAGNRCWAFRRFIRTHDFRASGSGKFDFNEKNIPPAMVESAFQMADKINSQSVAFDMVVKKNGEIAILEISYAWSIDAGKSHGWWDRNLNWHNESFMPQDVILEYILRKIEYSF